MKQKQLFMKSKLYPEQKSLALILRSVTNWSLSKCLKWVSKESNLERFYRYASKYYGKGGYTPPKYREEDLVKEFKFRGFVDIRDFKKKKICNYIQSSWPVGGTIWIYPKHFAHTIRALKRGYPYIWGLSHLICIRGYTRIDTRYQ